MKRYFFDVAGPGKPEYDYSGRTFLTPGKAHEFAEFLACDLAVSSDEWDGWRISVRSPEGAMIFSIPVRSSCLGAPNHLSAIGPTGHYRPV